MQRHVRNIYLRILVTYMFCRTIVGYYLRLIGKKKSAFWKLLGQILSRSKFQSLGKSRGKSIACQLMTFFWKNLSKPSESRTPTQFSSQRASLIFIKSYVIILENLSSLRTYL